MRTYTEPAPCLIHVAVTSQPVTTKEKRVIDYAEIERLLKLGVSYNEICRTCKTSPPTVAKVAHRSGLMRGQGSVNRLSDATKQAIAAEFQKFPVPTTVSVAKKCNVSEATVRVYRGRAG